MDTTQHTDASFDPTLDGRELRDEELATIHGGFSIGSLLGGTSGVVGSLLANGGSGELVGGVLGGVANPLNLG